VRASGRAYYTRRPINPPGEPRKKIKTVTTRRTVCASGLCSIPRIPRMYRPIQGWKVFLLVLPTATAFPSSFCGKTEGVGMTFDFRGRYSRIMRIKMPASCLRGRRNAVVSRLSLSLCLLSRLSSLPSRIRSLFYSRSGLPLALLMSFQLLPPAEGCSLAVASANILLLLSVFLSRFSCSQRANTLALSR